MGWLLDDPGLGPLLFPPELLSNESIFKYIVSAKNNLNKGKPIPNIIIKFNSVMSIIKVNSLIIKMYSFSFNTKKKENIKAFYFYFRLLESRVRNYC